MSNGSWKRDQHVDVVRDSADRNDVDFDVLANADHVSPEVFLAIARNDLGSIFRAENNVNEDVGIGMSHENLGVVPPGLELYILPFPGLRPGLSHFVPPALGRLPIAECR